MTATNHPVLLFTQSKPLKQEIVQLLANTSVQIEQIPFVELSTVQTHDIPHFSNYDMCLFVSQQAVQSTKELIGDIDTEPCRFISLGLATAKTVELLFKKKCLVVDSYRSAHDFFVDFPFKTLQAQRWIVPISIQSAGKYRELASLANHPLQLEEWQVYQNQISPTKKTEIAQAFLSLPLQSSLIFASPSAWQHLVESVGEQKVLTDISEKQIRIFSIGSVTTEAIKNKRTIEVIQAKQQTMTSLVNTIKEVLNL